MPAHRPKILALSLALGLLPWPLRAAEPSPCHAINIPRLNAAEAIQRLAHQTKTQLLFPYDLARTRQAHGASGCLPLAEAMAIILKGTGLKGVLSENGVYAILEDGASGQQNAAQAASTPVAATAEEDSHEP